MEEQIIKKWIECIGKVDFDVVKDEIMYNGYLPTRLIPMAIDCCYMFDFCEKMVLCRPKIVSELFKKDMFYIQNVDAGYVGNAIMFWKKGNAGYTANIDDSQMFTEAEARTICINNTAKNKAWSVDYINHNTHRIVDHQYVSPEQTHKFN